MKDFNKLFEDFMKQGQDMAEKMGKDIADAQTAWIDQMQDFMPEGVADSMKGMVGEGLDAQTRALATVAGLTAKGAEDTAIVTAAIQSAMAAGASQREITEAILQMTSIGAVSGVPKAMMAAMSAFAMDGAGK